MDKLKSRMLAAAISMLPKEMLDSFPTIVEDFLTKTMHEVELEPEEAGAIIIVMEARDGLKIGTATLDEACNIRRVVKKMSVKELTETILNTVKNGL